MAISALLEIGNAWKADDWILERGNWPWKRHSPTHRSTGEQCWIFTYQVLKVLIPSSNCLKVPCKMNIEFNCCIRYLSSFTFWGGNELLLIFFHTVCVTKCFRSNAELWKFIQACDSFWVACRNVWTSKPGSCKMCQKALSRKNASFPTLMQNAQRYWRDGGMIFSAKSRKNVGLQRQFSSPFLCVFTRLIIV